MNKNKESNAEQDPDIRGAEAALRRAAQKARELGERTNTPVYVLRDGRIVNLTSAVDQHEASAPK
jgi:hypothetical protein